MAVLLRSYLVFLLVVNACKGQSQQANFCKPSISADKHFPTEGENVTITVKTCPRSENSTISWSKCGQIVGTCVRNSCTAENIKNDQSELESTFFIEKSSNARDNCIVTFKTDDIGLKYIMKIYKHPEKVSVTVNGKKDRNIQVRVTESIKLDVKTSCMYPRPFIHLFYKVFFPSQPESFQLKGSECNPQVYTSDLCMQ
ncbi:uncharacterized protein LOC134279819 [Saccostrea cucullata]|uniref:uncharacterized protein LOC134279819 n=1 Tax=Saccostrea cuccullata TaxID=36930 RepID=UPI002ED18294